MFAVSHRARDACVHVYENIYKDLAYYSVLFDIADMGPLARILRLPQSFVNR